MSVSARDVLKLIDSWHPRKCETEKDFERSLHKHLEKNLQNSNVIKQYAAGRVKGDIVVEDKILIEIKDCLQSTGQLQRLLGQLDIYNTQWKGQVIVVICGGSQRDLVKHLSEKVESLKPGFLDFEDQKTYLVVRGASAQKSGGSFFDW